MTTSHMPDEATTEFNVADETTTMPTSEEQPTKVWTAADATANASEPVAEVSTKPRVGQLIWALIVIAIGVFLIVLPFLNIVQLPFVFIGLIAALGLVLIISAFFVSKPKDR